MVPRVVENKHFRSQWETHPNHLLLLLLPRKDFASQSKADDEPEKSYREKLNGKQIHCQATFFFFSSSPSSSDFMLQHPKLMKIGRAGPPTMYPAQKRQKPNCCLLVLYCELARPLFPKPQGWCGTKFTPLLSLLQICCVNCNKGKKNLEYPGIMNSSSSSLHVTKAKKKL
ncbi:hypothetical protein CY35_04G013100 [Sphagnum magellanicum]|jgi:hypothetical protein|nr:hypothetical protein CY35_04G013100 [Sphagnum magellanicum]